MPEEQSHLEPENHLKPGASGLARAPVPRACIAGSASGLAGGASAPAIKKALRGEFSEGKEGAST